MKLTWLLGIIAIVGVCVAAPRDAHVRAHVDPDTWSQCRQLDTCQAPDYEPVCGIDEEGVPRTFNNSCDMDHFNCVEGSYYVAVKKGVC